jgi:ADP-heptose:LPS heptosyltransferase
MKKVFYIDGGAGRVIAAIPALKKYARLHPGEDWNVLIGGWDNLLWGIPELQDITYNPDTKGIFDNVIKHATQIITPEPYRVPGYFKQQLSLAEAFDVEINNTTDHSDLGVPEIILSKTEEKNAANIIADVKQQQQKSKTIVIQPFGRSIRKDRNDLIDDSSRSLDPKSYVALAKRLSSKYNLIFFGEHDFHIPEDTYTFKLQADLRMWSSIIEASDYFVGVDSVGQHMARALGKPGTVIIGSTFAVNTTYPEYFKVIEKPGFKKYSPIRICGLDSHLADRYNDKCMDFTDKEIDDIYKQIVEDIEKKVK